jgi:hypothetical protein
VRHTRSEGKVTEFMVQYEILVRGKWRPVVRYDTSHGYVVRYDTSHGYAHRDLMHADGRKEKVELLLRNLNICLTYAENDLRA